MTYFMLEESIKVIHQSHVHPFWLIFGIQFGGLAFGLYVLGSVIVSVLVPAKTMFLVSFTEAVFKRNTNGVTDFD